MFYLHVSNRTENLLRQLAAVLVNDPQQSLFDSELFLIQSQGMERMISQTMADALGSFCNYTYYLPQNFLNYIGVLCGCVEKTGDFEREVVSWKLEALLRETEGRVFFPLHNYLSGENSELKRFQLARRLAHIFDQYQLMRGEMITAWDAGRVITDSPVELWQKELWNRLTAKAANDSEDVTHRTAVLHRLIRKLENDSGDGDALACIIFPKRISVVGLHTLPPVYLQFLNGLARHMDVHFFLLSPCEKYWGDVESMKKQFKNKMRGEGDYFEMVSHPLLASLGGQGRDLQNLLLEGANFEMDFSSYTDPVADNENPSLLHLIQKDLLQGRIDREGQFASGGDDSVIITSCHSKLRELGILRDRVLYQLEKDSALELRDIVVMAPDIQEYSALIPAVFKGIQYSIADRSIKRRNSVIAAFGSFLELLTTRFELSEVLDVLFLPAVYPHFNMSPTDLDMVRHWVEESGIRWGLSRENRENLNAGSFAATSWRTGLERMLMGAAVNTTDFIEGILPYPEIEGQDFAILGGLCRFIELLESAEKSFSRFHNLSEWVALFSRLAEGLFGETEESEYVELREVFTELGTIGEKYHHVPVNSQVILKWFGLVATESRSSSGFLRGQLTFCSMLPMRSIPFKVVCLLGLNEADFPKKDRGDTFDLMALAPRRGDRSPRADDRYQFLEAILAARELLYLSYVGRSARTNEPVPPSIVLTEFLDVLSSGYGVNNAVVEHPLHPFNSSYFSGKNERLFSYDKASCELAREMRNRKQTEKIWWQGSVDKAKKDCVGLQELLRFYGHPQKYFVQTVLGLELAQETGITDNSEQFSVDTLDKYLLESGLIDAILKGMEEGQGMNPRYELELKKVQVQGRWPLGIVGEMFFDESRALCERLCAQLTLLDPGKRLAPLNVECEVASVTVTGVLEQRYTGGMVIIRPGKLRGKDMLCAWVQHLLHNRLCADQPTYLLTADGVFYFSGIAHFDENWQRRLDKVVTLYLEGCEEPSLLLTEPLFEYVQQITRKKATITPLEKAVETYQKKMQNGYEPYWKKLYAQGGEPACPINSDFEQLAQGFMLEIWREMKNAKL